MYYNLIRQMPPTAMAFATVRLRCPILSLARTPASMIDRGTLSTPAASATGSAGVLRPDSHLRFESDRQSQKADTQMGICFFGAGDRTRTGTLSPAVDFESTTSTIPSHRHGAHILYYKSREKSSKTFSLFPGKIYDDEPWKMW